MPVQLSIADTEKAISNRLVKYIETEYFGKTPELLSRCEKTLAAPGTLFQKPYLEATKAYQLADGGIGNAAVPERIKTFLQMYGGKGQGSVRQTIQPSGRIPRVVLERLRRLGLHRNRFRKDGVLYVAARIQNGGRGHGIDR